MKSILTAVLLISFNTVIFSQEFKVVADSSDANQQQQTTQTNTNDNQQQPKPDEKKKKSDKGFKPENLMIGGGVGLGFSNYGGSVNVAPIVGYRFHKHFHAAVKLSYWYTWHRAVDPLNREHKIDDNMYTLSAFGRVVLFKGLYLHVEPEYMNRSSFTTNYWIGTPTTGYELPPTTRVDVFNFYLGPGFYQGNGQRGVFIQLLWNLNQTDDSYFANPFLQVGFSF